MVVKWNYFGSFFDANAKRSDAKDYGNAIHPNMFATSDNIDESTLVLRLVPPPELHLLIGPVNTLYDELSKHWPDCEEWLKRLSIKRDDYHGGQFNGNDSRKLMKKNSILEEFAPTKANGFIETFQAFNEVITSCYGTDLSPGYKQMIKNFRICYRRLKMNVTPKVHAVFFHVEEYCEMVGMGLGPWSEPAAESLHTYFDKIWARYKVRDTDNDKYGKRLFDAVVAYNSPHL